MNISISVIITTYNWPSALNAVLRSVCAQKYPKLEIIIADDGSSDETKATFEHWQRKSPYPLRHIWQEDKGFRAAKARNRAIAVAKHDFIVFLDGDCVIGPHFITRYSKLAKNGSFVSGNRVLLEQEFTARCLNKNIPFEKWSLSRWGYVWFNGGCNRLSPLLRIPLGPLRHRSSHNWKGVKTCNLGVWREDLLKVNGLDEDYSGWGYEDSDLVIRLLRRGITRIEGRFAIPVFHLWHQMQSRKDAKENFARLASIQNESRVKAVQGLDQYL
jgi:glycosyltransferase involved in cell wall biosynthesis